jgi:hypothetical protein
MILSDKPKQKAGYRMEMIEDELLLYHLDETRILYLNQTASLIWRLCDGQRTVGEITTLLGEAYPESAGTIADDVQKTLQQFLEFGAINNA